MGVRKEHSASQEVGCKKQNGPGNSRAVCVFKSVRLERVVRHGTGRFGIHLVE